METGHLDSISAAARRCYLVTWPLASLWKDDSVISSSLRLSDFQDRNQPEVTDKYFHDVPFDAHFASELSEFHSVSSMPGVDGFTLKVDALYKVRTRDIGSPKLTPLSRMPKILCEL